MMPSRTPPLETTLAHRKLDIHASGLNLIADALRRVILTQDAILASQIALRSELHGRIDNMAGELSALQGAVDQLVQLTPVTVAKISELRAAGVATPAELKALADTLTTKVAQPLAAATADPAPTA